MSGFELFNLLETKSIRTPKIIRKKRKDKKSPEECNHSNIITEKGSNVCTECGQEITENAVDNEREWAYYGCGNKRSIDPSFVQARRKDDKSIFKDLEGLGFNDQIVSKANKYFEEVSGGHIYRGKTRKGIVFACVFHACKELNQPQSHNTLLDIFDLEQKVGSEGLKKVSMKAPKNSSILTTYITPLDLVNEIMNNFSASDSQKNEVKELYLRIENRSSELNRSRPQSIASGLVYYWIKKNNYNKISLKDFAEKVKLSALTITKISKIISKVLGDEDEKSNFKDGRKKKNEQTNITKS